MTVSGNGQTYTAAASANGSFVISGLPPATYSVFLSLKASTASVSAAVASGGTSSVRLVLKQR